MDAVTGLPHNPLQDAGAVATASLVKGRGGRDRTARMMQLLSALFDREVTVTESAARAENRAQHHTRSAAWLMKSLDTLDADPETLLEDIATVRAAAVTVEDLALRLRRRGTEVVAVDTLPGPLDLSHPGSDVPVRDRTAARLVERERTERLRRLAAAGVVVGPAEASALARVLREVARRRRQVGR